MLLLLLLHSSIVVFVELSNCMRSMLLLVIELFRQLSVMDEDGAATSLFVLLVDVVFEVDVVVAAVVVVIAAADSVFGSSIPR